MSARWHARQNGEHDVAPVPRRWTREEYHALGEAGLIPEDERVELIEGEILKMTPIGSPHDGNNRWLTMFFAPKLEGRAIVSVQGVLGIEDDSEPEPDFVLLKPRDDYYRRSHATAADALLVIEVAQPSRSFDLGRKARLYARGGVPEYWVVDMLEQRLVRHLGPLVSAEWSSIKRFGPEESLAPQAFPDVVVELKHLLEPLDEGTV
ncbi:MAG: Uma2 family endonuclease [Planctomycetota bacterium]